MISGAQLQTLSNVLLRGAWLWTICPVLSQRKRFLQAPPEDKNNNNQSREETGWFRYVFWLFLLFSDFFGFHFFNENQKTMSFLGKPKYKKKHTRRFFVFLILEMTKVWYVLIFEMTKALKYQKTQFVVWYFRFPRSTKPKNEACAFVFFLCHVTKTLKYKKTAVLFGILPSPEAENQKQHMAFLFSPKNTNKSKQQKKTKKRQ